MAEKGVKVFVTRTRQGGGVPGGAGPRSAGGLRGGRGRARGQRRGGVGARAAAGADARGVRQQEEPRCRGAQPLREEEEEQDQQEDEGAAEPDTQL